MRILQIGIMLLTANMACLTAYAQYQWPFPNPNQQGTVVGSVGEARDTDNTPRFHQGVDLTNGNSYAVHAINSGTIVWNNLTGRSSILTVTTISGVVIRYVHVNPLPGIGTTTTTVAIGDHIGTMAQLGTIHVHLESANINFLDNNLSPFVDQASPYFSTAYLPNGVAFYRNGLLRNTVNHAGLLLNQQYSISGTARTLLYNKIDIVAHVIDPRTASNGQSGGGQCVPTEISWRVRDYNNIILTRSELNFTGIPNNAAALSSFHPQSNDVDEGNPSIHILTSHPTATPWDRFFNSGLRIGQTENWTIGSNRPPALDARANCEAAYPDGNYTIEINAHDVDFNNNPNNGAPQRNVNVLIDNFRPYIKEIIVRKNGSEGRLISRGFWEWNSTSGQLSFKHDQGDDAGITDAIWIKIIASEPVQNVRLNVPIVNGNDFFEVNQVIPNSNNKEFIAILNPIASSGDQTIRIQAEDYAGNPLQSDPALIPIRQADGTWSAGVQPGIDANHYFKTGTFVCTNSGNPGGRTASNSSTTSPCLYADFSVSQSTALVNEGIKFSPVASGSGVITYSWNFGSGAIPATSISGGLQTVTYTTAGPKTVTLQICDATTNCLIAEKVNAVTVLGNGSSEITVDFSASPTVAKVGQSIQLTSNVLGASGPVSYSWRFDTGVNQGAFFDANPVISYSTPGNKSISLTVTDASGNAIKVKNSFLLITSDVYNVNPTIQGGCITVGADGMASFSAFVTGGNGPPYDSYLWDFGDGETSTMPTPLPHKYTKTGKYTVRLTVCDETSCGTTEVVNCVTVPWITDTNSLQPDFMINNVPYPTVYSPYEVGLNTPVTFTNTTTGGGSQLFLTYNWDFESHFLPGWGEGNTIESATPANATTVGPHEVYYTVPGNKESRLVVGTTGVGSFVRDKKRPSVKVVAGRGSGRCYANVGEVKISSTCWSPSAIPVFTIPVSKTNCPVAKTEVLYWDSTGSAVVLPGNKLDFAAMGVPVPQFPLTSDFSFAVYQFDGVSYNRIGYKRQRFTIYGPVQVNAGVDKNICVGSTVTLGSTAPDNHSFLWSTTNANDLNFLSSKTSPNPVFTGTQKGTYKYNLKVTSTLNGCVSLADEVIISVNEPKVSSISYSPRPSESITLSPVVSDGFGGNNFTWTPALNLNNSQSATPTFSSAVEGNYSYNVSVKDINGCTGSGQVFVNVSDAAGDVTGTPASFSRIIVSWKDRSNNETGYLIRKSIGNNSSYFDLATVGPNVTSYEDLNVLKDVKYYYHVVTLFGATSKSSLEFSVNTNTLSAFSYKSIPYDMFGRVGDFDNDLDLDFVVGTHVIWNSSGNFSSQSLTVGTGFFDAVGDFDSDDDLDIFNGKVLKNNNGSFNPVIWSDDPKNDRPIAVDLNVDNHVDIVDNRKIRTNIQGNSFNTFESSLPVTHGQYGPGQTYALGDMDNDGDHDMVSQSEFNLIVTPNSAGIFLGSTIIESNAFITGLYMGQFEIGDLNNDGLLDIACAAIYKNLTLYLNKGNFSFSKIVLPNTKINDRGLLKLGDMDNDGDLDILITGNPYLWDNSKKYNAVFENNNGAFTQITLPIGEPMLIDWVDFDNDGDLDILASGYGVDGIYVNNLNSNKYRPNTKPVAPQNLCSTLAGNKLTMSWSRASDGETPAPGLTYNVYVKQNGAWVMTPMSNPVTGYRKVAQRGNVDHNLSWTITLPNTGNIEWGVQAVDNQYIGSSFTTTSLQYSPIANTSKTICSGEKSNLVISSASANPIFSWTVKDTSPNISGASAGSGNILDQTLTNSSNTTAGVVTYEITEFFPACLKKKYEVRVTVNPGPSSVVSLNGSPIICQGESVRLTAPTGINYLWTNGSTNSYIDVTIAGTYSVLVTNQFGCNQRSGNVQIKVNPRPKIFITPASPVLICQGSSVTLTASPQYVSQGSSLVLANIFTWSSGVISNSITVSNPGIYTVSTYNIQNNCTISNTIEVLHYTPVINIIRSGDVCLNGSAVLSYSGPAYTSLLWSTGATSNSIIVYGTGSYSVTANFSGCSGPVTDYEVINPCNIDPCLNKVKNRIDPCAIARKAADVANETETNELWLVDEPTLFPNPASSRVIVAIPYVTEKDIPITLYDMTGREVLSSNLNSGRYYCEIIIPDVPDGLYLVEIGIGINVVRQKLEILKK